VSNLVTALGQCGEDIRQRMLWYFSQADAEYARRVAEGLGAAVPLAMPPGARSGAVRGEGAGVGGAGAIG